MKISARQIRGGILLSAVFVAATAPPASTQEPPSLQDVWRLDRSEPITYFIAEGSPESGFKEGDRTLAEWALEAWGSQSDPSVEMVPGPEASATIRVYWVPAGAGLYGEMRGRVVEGRLAADVFVHPDTEGLGPDIAQRARLDPLFRDAVVYLTCVHELGHAFGLPIPVLSQTLCTRSSMVVTSSPTSCASASSSRSGMTSSVPRRSPPPTAADSGFCTPENAVRRARV